ncbi:MAG: 2Fe-2S iron-sulfur cluster-binding protein [Filomicrobium sp.]
MSDTTIKIHVELPDGSLRTLEAPEGYRVMEVIRDYGLPIKAECGGACACATCHVRLPDGWVDRVIPARDEEMDKLDEIPSADDYSRLCCQILTDTAIDGLVVRLEPDSILEEEFKIAS